MRVHACAELVAPVAASISALAVRRLSGVVCILITAIFA